MRYMSLIRCDESQGPPPQALMDAMGVFIEAEAKAGRLIDTGGFAASAEGVRVRLEGGNINVTDGPFTEAKELIGGYAVMEYGSREAAIEGARQFMQLHLDHWPEFVGECEVRQVFGPND